MRYWKLTKSDGSTSTVESYSHDLDVAGATEITEAEFKAFMATLPSPTPPVNWRALWLAADTVAKKIAVLAKRLELE